MKLRLPVRVLLASSASCVAVRTVHAAVCEVQGAKANGLSGRILAAAQMQAHNTFDKPEDIKPGEFSACKTADTGFTATFPAKSVVVLTMD